MSAIEIPGYKIIKTLGVGGQATVYLAIQQGFDREVALKVMSPALAADPTFGERFIREAKIVAKLSHARIVTVYDVGESGSFYYLAMEYMRGKDLKTRVATGLKAKEALTIIAKLAQALHFAHKKGYIHRDVKSENILFDDDDQPVLTDFGIAKASNSSTQMTQTGKLIGTPEYMSPEQCRGRKLDGRSDLYSLGIILYEMMTRTVPFTGEDSVSVCIQHVTKPMPQLPARLNHFQWLVDGLLDKNPDGRFQTGQELASAIKDYLVGGKQSEIKKSSTDKPAVLENELSSSRREDFSDETFELNDNFQVDQRINVAPETKSRVPLIATLFVLIIASASGYVLRASWLPQARSILGLDTAQTNTQDEQSEEISSQANQQQKLTPKTKSRTEPDSTLPSRQPQTEENKSETNRVSQLISQADTLAQYSPHELADIQQALDNLTTAKSLEPANQNVIRIKNNVILIALEEAKASAKNDQFDNAYDWLKLVESADHDNRQLDSTRRIVADHKRTYDSNISQREKAAKELSDNLQSAQLALSENRLGAPVKDNAIYYFESAFKLDPQNIQATKGLNEVAEKYKSLISKAVKDKKFLRARSLLGRLKTIPHINRDFSELENQVSVAKRLFDKRLKEKQRLESIAEEKRLKEKKRQDKLADPLIQMRLQSTLDTARSLFEQGNLVEPVGNNALDKYKAVLEIDSRDQSALDGINTIEKHITDNIEVALSNQIEAPARQWLAKLRVFDPEHASVDSYLLKIEEMIVAIQMIKPETSSSDNTDAVQPAETEGQNNENGNSLENRNFNDLQTSPVEPEAVESAVENSKQMESVQQVQSIVKPKTKSDVSNETSTDKTQEENEQG